MLHFLSSLLLRRDEGADRLDPTILERAIERVVDGTDPRLRYVGGYQKRLRKAVQTAALWVIGLVDDLPEPTALERRNYTVDPRLRAFFAAPDRISEVVGQASALRDYLRRGANPFGAEVYGLLTMEWSERKVLGMDLARDQVQRDVAQVVVEFANHRFVAVSGDEDETRREIKLRAFDYLIELALGKLVEAREHKDQLQRQHQLLRQKLDTMRAGNWGLEQILEQPAPEPDLTGLESELAQIEKNLLASGTPAEHLAKALETVADTLARAAELIDVSKVPLRLNQMNVMVQEDASGPSAVLDLEAVASASGERRILLLSRVPRTELPVPPDLVDEAMRFLG
jgi:hypothetical protein